MEKRTFTYITMGLLVWALLGTVATGYYFVQYVTYETEYQTLVDQLNAFYDVIGNLTVSVTDYNELVSELDANVKDVRSTLEGVALKVNVLLGFDAESKMWFNDTTLPLGATAFTGIYSISDSINYTDYGGELGILVTSINDVTNNATHGWFYWQWIPTDSQWILPSYSSAKYILRKGDTIAFTYVSYADWPPNPPT
ncbi:MAG: hypothetical protein JSV35_07875 [Candidatus Bathyarchaeota archaeon]|nr:MAG: hypothetical protein JSV35_07875 [Candidatus Bathyarchaeota archaeon]